MVRSAPLEATQFNPTMETYYKRGCDRRIRSAAFVQDSTVTTEVMSGYTQGMPGLEKNELSVPGRDASHSQ
jgi:hypothetical protein